MAWSYVQGATVDNSGGPSISVTPAIGNLMVVYLFSGAVETALISDTQGNVWTRMIGSQVNPGTLSAWWAVAKNSAATVISFTATPTMAAYYGEYLWTPAQPGAIGAAGGNGQAQAGPGSGADAITSGNITTVEDGDLIVGLSGDFSASYAPGAGTGETARAASSITAGVYDAQWVDKVQPAKGTVAATWTSDAGHGANSFVSLAAAFRPPSSALPLGQGAM
jgi:hypothetical protein